ncbi:MAG: 16S rRNA (adenine(1518)-N(6)/adenine(1519)-N(6))-dimethyltransferase RsmA [Lachnospiraceae bacterium]|jgi:16S rRNA (adenine1518-N6/adenine1519-N6)-dimethyltransferase|nr:16S rRNA (adenine(1518)-N(6)/adenine(1519)-N(6))-dimethyltransferase RsmA [Lachnospiraceae bacterium]
MADLGNAKSTAEVIKKYGFSFQKRYGQNFLIDAHVLDKIIDAADIGKEDGVIEIGPGIGTMTQRLCERAAKVVAVEIDKELIPILSDTLSGYSNLKIINADVMKTDMTALIRDEFAGMNVKVVANLPYYITTPIVMSLLEQHLPLSSITIMVQKEVAVRMQAGPGTKDYGALSLAVQYYADTYIAANVPPNCFMPRPKVGSSVIRLTVRNTSEIEVTNEKLMFDLIRASFNQRRKTLVNAIGNFAGLDISKEAVAKALNDMGLDENVRGETLDLRQFAALSNILT